MRLTEIRHTDALPVDGYGPGFFRIGGQVHRGAVAVLPAGVVRWGGLDDTASLLPAAGAIDVLLVGTGATMARLPAPFRTALEDAGVGAEPMASPQACRTYNVLLGEGRRVGLAVLPL